MWSAGIPGEWVRNISSPDVKEVKALSRVNEGDSAVELVHDGFHSAEPELCGVVVWIICSATLIPEMFVKLLVVPSLSVVRWSDGSEGEKTVYTPFRVVLLGGRAPERRSS